MSNKNIYIQRFRIIIQKLKKLKPQHFDYADYVKYYDKDDNCGTVCCVAGWLPKWFPSQWEWHTKQRIRYSVKLINSISPVCHVELSDFLGIDETVVLALFKGEQQNLEKLSLPTCKEYTLAEVTKLFEAALVQIQNGHIAIKKAA